MTSVFEITDWAGVASFFIWTLAVCALAKAIFGSFPAAELQYRLALRDAPRRRRIGQLQWEINNRARWDADAARGSPHDAKHPLTDAELDARTAELKRFMRTSLLRRASAFFLSCFACQTFWTAVMIFAVTRGVADVVALFFSAAAYSGAAAVMLRPRAVELDRVSRPVGTRSGGCGNCGK